MPSHDGIPFRAEKRQGMESIAHIERALALSPTDPVASFWYYWLGMAAAQAGDFKGSLQWMLRAEQANPRYKAPRPWVAIAHARLGDVATARQLIEEYLADSPDFSVEGWMKLLSRGSQGISARLAPFGDLLRELGAPPSERRARQHTEKIIGHGK
jgi:tetratricopeptide (TPR) repeat protein